VFIEKPDTLSRVVN